MHVLLDQLLDQFPADDRHFAKIELIVKQTYRELIISGGIVNWRPESLGKLFTFCRQNTQVGSYRHNLRSTDILYVPTVKTTSLCQ